MFLRKVLQEVHKMTINDLKTGSCAQIKRLDLLSPCVPRLLDLGFVPGTQVQLLARAPLGEPILVQLRHHTLMLRKSEAQSVFVRLEEKK